MAESPESNESRDRIKEQFRKALEHKQQENHRSADAARQEGNVRGSETVGQGRRVFRRKSG